MWTGVLVLAIAGSILNLLFVRVERRILAWHHQARTALDAL
jgi:sulfonate transport system permease protein